MDRKVVSLVFAFLFACLVAEAQTPQQLAQKTFPSVVMIVTSDASGQPLALGSGFAVANGVIATNMHVIEGAAAARLKIVGRPDTYTVGGVVGTDPAADLALLKINGLETPPLQLGDSKQAAVGEQVFAVGNPEGLEGTFSEGIVSGIRTIGTDELLQITAPISPGSSGGPVIDVAGKVLGISVATFKEGQNLNFAVPVSYLKALIARTGGAAVTPLSSAAPQSPGRSIVEQMGSAATTGVTGGKFLWENQLFEYGDYSFTLTNHLDQPVQNVSGFVIFYAEDGTPLDANKFYYDGEISPGLGKRVKSAADPSVKRMTTSPDSQNRFLSAFTPSAKVEFRILNFEIAR